MNCFRYASDMLPICSDYLAVKRLAGDSDGLERGFGREFENVLEGGSGTIAAKQFAKGI